MFKVLSATADRAEWDALFARLPPELQDVHFTSAYARVQMSHCASHAMLATFAKNSQFVMQPFLLSPVANGEYFDLSSLYGYGGPVGTDGELGSAFQNELWNWARREYVVAEFCALHPLFDQIQSALLDLVTRTYMVSKEVVIVELAEFDAEHVSRRVRRGVKSAKEAGARVHDGTPRGFSVLYDMAMKRLGAGDSWKYPHEYWDAHQREHVGAKFYELSTMRPNGILQRSLLTVGTNGTAYAHFLGSDGESRREGLDDYLYFEAARDLRSHGFKRFHLGGDAETTAPTNSLLQFKSGFSDKRLTAKRYGRIFDASGYDSLCNRMAMHEHEQHGRESTAQFFPMYRRPFE
jgi:hypothetical protein